MSVLKIASLFFGAIAGIAALIGFSGFALLGFIGFANGEAIGIAQAFAGVVGAFGGVLITIACIIRMVDPL